MTKCNIKTQERNYFMKVKYDTKQCFNEIL